MSTPLTIRMCTGSAVGAKVSYLWVIDNRLYRNSGDGIQINGGSIAGQPTTHHIYVARNIAYNNKQTGMWSKQAVDVIFSQNRCYGHRPSNSSMGMCMGYQDSTERMWFLYNVISDSEFGIGVGSNNDLGMGVDCRLHRKCHLQHSSQWDWLQSVRPPGPAQGSCWREANMPA